MSETQSQFPHEGDKPIVEPESVTDIDKSGVSMTDPQGNFDDSKQTANSKILEEYRTAPDGTYETIRTHTHKDGFRYRAYIDVKEGDTPRVKIAKGSPTLADRYRPVGSQSFVKYFDTKEEAFLAADTILDKVKAGESIDLSPSAGWKEQ